MAALTTSVIRPSISDRPVTRGLSVVVAADRPQDAEVLALTLEALGCEVATTTIGPTTIDLAFLAQPEVVILAPAGPGWGAVPEALAERAAWRKPFVIALTAPTAGDAVPGVHATADRPVSPDQLSDLVSRLRELLAGIQEFDPVI
jgi:DNA-binding response OmpR family regulator